MIELSALFAQMQVTGSLPFMQSSGGRAGGADSDGFSTLFQKAANEQRGSGNGPVGFLSRGEKSVNKDRATDEAPESDKEIPDELAALAQFSIIQEKQIETPPDLSVADQQQAVSAVQAEQPAITADHDAVVSILESNMDIDAQSSLPAETELPAQTTPAAIPIPGQAAETDHELTARMPQAPGQVQVTETDKPVTSDIYNEAAVTAEADGPCPLENKNDPQTGSSLEQGETAEDNSSSPEKDASRIFGTQQQVDISPERLSAAENLNSATTATATTQTLFDTMVQNILMSSTAESSYMEIQLKPDFLGKVSIQLALSDNGLEIKIKSDDMSVKNLIAGQIAQLSETLSEKGVKVNQIDVIYTDVSDHTFGQSASDNDNSQSAWAFNGGSKKAGTVNFGFGIGFTEEAEMVSILDTGISSVEYRA